MGCSLLGGSARAGSNRALPLGVGIDDVQLHVVNPAGQPAGLGEHGEIWVRTPHLASGYLAPDGQIATGPVFTTTPHGDRWYRTGDLGRHLLDGRIEFLGRRDAQVKVRGFRVEPAEITAALSALPGVTAAHVGATEAAGGEQRLIAHVAGARLDPEEIQLALRAALPGHMVPEQVIVRDALPLTANGKLDTAALRRDAVRAVASDGYRPPTTEIERLVAGVWRAVLSAGAIGRDENFFDVGGNSMRLAQVQARLTAALGREVAMVDLFRYPTIRTLGASLERGAPPTPAVSRAPRRVMARRELRARRVSSRR
jgi:aryl carrier-like protein